MTAETDKIACALDEGRTLPASWYSDPAIFGLESRLIFGHSWQYCAHLEQLANPGDFITTRLGAIPTIITRDDSGAVRAFANVCRHRGSEVVLQCSGNRKTLQCHYHGWTYNLDGSLRAAPRSAEQVTFPREQLGLSPFAIETWGPLLFVNPDRDAPPLADLFGELAPISSGAGISLNQLRLRRNDVYEIAANWKIVIENFNECYHCPIAHPAFSEVINVDEYRVDTSREYFSTYYGPYRKSAQNGVTYATLWPDLMFAFSTDPPAMQVLRAARVDAGHTRQMIDYYFADSATEQQIRDYIELSDIVTREDVTLCESVQRGLASGVVPEGHLMLSRERGIQHFQRLVCRFLGGAQDNGSG